jgi:hypothetical protein
MSREAESSKLKAESLSLPYPLRGDFALAALLELKGFHRRGTGDRKLGGIAFACCSIIQM